MAKYIGRHRRNRPIRPVAVVTPVVNASVNEADTDREPVLAGR